MDEFNDAVLPVSGGTSVSLGSHMIYLVGPRKELSNSCGLRQPKAVEFIVRAGRRVTYRGRRALKEASDGIAYCSITARRVPYGDPHAPGLQLNMSRPRTHGTTTTRLRPLTVHIRPAQSIARVL